MSLFDNTKKVSGTGDAADGSADQTLIAAPGKGKRIYVQKGFVAVTVASAGNTGFVALEDGIGGTRIFEADADSVGIYPIDFGEIGYPLSLNTLLNLTVDGDGATEATARATITGIVI